jgi:hypothetical protein
MSDFFWGQDDRTRKGCNLIDGEESRGIEVESKAPGSVGESADDNGRIDKVPDSWLKGVEREVTVESSWTETVASQYDDEGAAAEGISGDENTDESPSDETRDNVE